MDRSSSLRKVNNGLIFQNKADSFLMDTRDTVESGTAV